MDICLYSNTSPQEVNYIHIKYSCSHSVKSFPQKPFFACKLMCQKAVFKDYVTFQIRLAI